MRSSSTNRVARFVDVVQYAVGLTVLFAVSLSPISLLAGMGLRGVKYGLFLLGILSLGYATWLAWPRTPDDLAEEGNRGEETKLQALLRRLPPASRYPLAPADRARNWVRLYLASVTMLASSFAMETVFGL